MGSIKVKLKVRFAVILLEFLLTVAITIIGITFPIVNYVLLSVYQYTTPVVELIVIKLLRGLNGAKL